MKKPILFVGLDVDDNQFHVHTIHTETGEEFNFACKPNISALTRKLEKLCDNKMGVKICYESTYLGFSLCRALQAKGYFCEVVASSLIPDMAGKKVKNDRLDSESLARYYMNGLLTVVKIPDHAQECVRDISRSREFLVEQLKSVKLHILSLCRRMNLNYKQDCGRKTANYWTLVHRKWLKQKALDTSDSNLRFNLQSLLFHINQVEEQINKYEEEILKISEQDFYKEKVATLRCFRGINTISAMVFITELGDVNRFSHPSKITSFVGLDLLEYSSGNKERRYGISKMGNRRLRKTAVEVCQTVSLLPNISKQLSQRRKGVSPEKVAVADRCMQRLHKRSKHLIFKGKPINKVKVACARELYGFIWEALKTAS